MSGETEASLDLSKYLAKDATSKTTIADLPEEIFEFIFMKVSPYNDLKSVSLICTSWHRLVQVVRKKLQHNFIHSVFTSSVKWSTIKPEAGSRITERYSHCCCYYDKSLYVFGGCTATNTTLNDLWRFDLAKREWIRPLAMGTYPYPKACATLVVYKDNLVLFGGWSHPTPFPLHQAARFFSELHIYKPSTNRWSHVTTLSHQSPQPLAGHSASVLRDWMVIFGGSQVPGIRTNEVWFYDFTEEAWKMPRIGYKRPAPRYGHVQVTLDDKHILILGGCGGGVPNQVFTDCWLLTVGNGDEEWTWDPVHLDNMGSAAPQLWCHGACKVSNMIVTLGKPARTVPRTVPVVPRAVPPSSKTWVPPSQDEIEQTVNSANQKAGLNAQARSRDKLVPSSSVESPDSDSRESGEISDSGSEMDQSEESSVSHDTSSNQSVRHPPVPVSPSQDAGSSTPRPGLPSVRPNAMKDRQKQLDALLKYEKKLRRKEAEVSQMEVEGNLRLPQNAQGIKQNKPQNAASLMTLHVLDISRVLTSGTAAWQKVNYEISEGAPEETIFYTLVEGRGELLMFGGIEKDIHALQKGQGIKSQTVNNCIHVVSPIQPLL